MKRRITTVSAVGFAVFVAACASAAPIYWQFDEESGANPQDCISDIDLARDPDSGGRSALYCANPIPNPDTSTWRAGEGDPAANTYSALSPRFYRNTTHFQMRDNRSWTLEGWFRRNLADGALNTQWGEMIVCTRNNAYHWPYGWVFLMLTSGQLNVSLFRSDDTSAGMTTSGTYADAAWHHFALTWDHDNGANGYVKLYVDGNLEAEMEGLGTLLSNYDMHQFTIGYRLRQMIATCFSAAWTSSAGHMTPCCPRASF